MMSNSIAIASGKGGVGKTTIAVNLALTLSQMGTKVSPMDADFGLANAHIMLGINPKKTIRDVLKNQMTVEDVIEKGPQRFKVYIWRKWIDRYFKYREKLKIPAN